MCRLGDLSNDDDLAYFARVYFIVQIIVTDQEKTKIMDKTKELREIEGIYGLLFP